MVGVSEGMISNVPGLVPRDLFFINQDSEELNGRDSWVSIIKLDLVLFWEFIPVCMELLKPSNDVSDSCTTEKVLLLQSKFFPLFS
jgi:hypothetical protein